MQKSYWLIVLLNSSLFCWLISLVSQSGKYACMVGNADCVSSELSARPRDFDWASSRRSSSKPSS